MNNFIRKGGLWVLGQSLLTLAVLVLGLALHGQPWHWTWLVLGAVFVVVGAAFLVAGVRALGRNLTPYPKPVEGAHLMQAGIYGIMRHPLYSSMILLALGWSLLWSSKAALLAALGLAVLLDAKARQEERWLRERFPEYDDYTRRVRRFVPWLF